MSGGHFDYQQYRLNDIAMELDELIKSNEDESLNEWGERRGRFYPEDIIERFKEAREVLEVAANMVQRIDWLVSGDDGEESFRERWKEDVRSLRIGVEDG